METDFESDSEALEFIRSNPDWEDPRLGAVLRLFAWLPTIEHRWAFLYALDGPELRDETLEWLGIFLMNELIQGDGMACEPGLSAGISHKNFRTMLKSTLPRDDDVRDMVESFLSASES